MRRHIIYNALFDLVEAVARFVDDRALRIAGDLLHLAGSTLAMALQILVDLDQRRRHRFDAGCIDFTAVDNLAE